MLTCLKNKIETEEVIILQLINIIKIYDNFSFHFVIIFFYFVLKFYLFNCILYN